MMLTTTLHVHDQLLCNVMHDAHHNVACPWSSVMQCNVWCSAQKQGTHNIQSMTLNILSYCFAATWFFDGVHVVHPLRFLVVLLCVFIFWVMCCYVLLCVFTFWVLCCDVRFDFRKTTMFGSSLSLVAHVFFTLFVHGGIQHILCCVFVLFFSFCVPYVASFSGLSIFDCQAVIFNVHLPSAWIILRDITS